MENKKGPRSRLPHFVISLVVFVVALAVIITAVIIFRNHKTIFLPKTNTTTTWLKNDTTINLPKKNENEIVSSLPKQASTVRINLPTSIKDLVIYHKNGLGGLGVQTDDPQVTNYIWMDIKSGVEINSMASGKVTKITQKGTQEFEVVVNFSYGLWGRYQAIQKPLVTAGALVRENQPIGIGLVGSQPNTSLLVFSLADENIATGTPSPFSPGMIVKPLDYLKPDVKAIILSQYK